MSIDRARRGRGLVAALGVAAITVAAVTLRDRGSSAARLVRSAASERSRPIEGRLAGFAYAPRAKNVATGQSVSALRAVAGAVRANSRSEPHTSAIATLLFGESAEAVRSLETL